MCIRDRIKRVIFSTVPVDHSELLSAPFRVNESTAALVSPTKFPPFSGILPIDWAPETLRVPLLIMAVSAGPGILPVSQPALLVQLVSPEFLL